MKPAPDAYGHWYYRMDGPHNELLPGQVVYEQFLVQTTDENGHTIVQIDITGTSEGKPTVTSTDLTTEEGAPAVNSHFTVTAPDGLASITVGNTVVTEAQLQALGTTQQSVHTANGELTLTGYNTSTGEVSTPISHQHSTTPTVRPIPIL